ncbi:MAG: hypothetical protein ACRDRE_17290 [Pseudonocardiaceae bacterium]
MAAVKRSLFLAPTLAIALGAGGFVSAAAAPSPPPLPPGVDLSSDAAQGLIDRALAGINFDVLPSKLVNKEVINLSTIPPIVEKWRSAIARRDVAASIQAGEDYEAAWQAVEVYINHRSLPLYRDIEVDTQFVIQAGLEQPSPDWPRLLELADHLRQQIGVTIGFIAVQPALHPLFDDLVPLRGVRAQLLISSDALAAGNVPKARTFFNKFNAGFPGVEPLIRVRSTVAADETKAAVAAAAAKFAEPNPSAADLTPLVATVNNRYGFGVNLLNAAARTSDVKKTTFTEADKTALRQLNDVLLCLKRSLPKFPGDKPGAAECGTEPGSLFALVQPALESRARLVNTAATLRVALANYNALILRPTAPTVAEVTAANKTAREAVALAQQTIAGQFWTDPALQTFLDSLPKV